MLVLRIELDAPDHAVPAVKEHLAMELERFGDVRVVSVDAVPSSCQQLHMWAAERGYREAYQQARRG